MKKKSLLTASIRSFALGAKTATKPFIGLAIFSLLSGILSLASIGSFSLLINKVSEMIQTSGFQSLHIVEVSIQLLPYFAILFAAYFFPSVVTNWQNYYQTVFSERFMTAIQLLFVKKQSTMDAATLESSLYQSKIQQGNEWGKNSLVAIIMQNFAALSFLATVIITLIALLAIDYRLAIIATVSCLPLYYIEQKYSRKLFQVRRLHTDEKRLTMNRVSLFHSQYSLIELNMFGSSKKFIHELDQVMNEQDDKIISLQKSKNNFQTFLRIYTVLLSVVTGVLIVQKGISGVVPIGLMVFAFSAYNSFYAAMSNFFLSLSFAQDASRYVIIWFEVFDTLPFITTKEQAIIPDYEHPPTIEFVGVSFSYPGNDKKSLSNINLLIKPEEKLAIVGMSGAGKTTLIKLLARVYDPTEGQILVNGTDLKDIDVKSWQNYLGVMFQSYGTYNVTIEESVALGRSGDTIDQENIETSLELAGAHDFVSGLAKGLKTLIWKGFKNGTDLSKGEHQRLAIARIFYRNPLVYVLDEPTSSVDALTAQKIFNNFEQKTVGKTVILISHNFSTVKDSSNIVVLEGGTIIEQGAHAELHSKNGRYTELYDSQANAFENKAIA